ncbi:hypothetical protein ABPG72_004709 [Tetrahymena utriculariae]
MAEITLFELKGTVALHNLVKRHGPIDKQGDNKGSEKQFCFKQPNNLKIDSFTLEFQFFPLQKSKGKDEQNILTIFSDQQIILQLKIVEQNQLRLYLKEHAITEYNVGFLNIMEQNIVFIHIQEGNGFAQINNSKIEIQSHQFLTNGIKLNASKYILHLSTKEKNKHYSGTITDLLIRANQHNVDKQLISQALFNTVQSLQKINSSQFHEDYIEPIKSLQELYYFDCSKDPLNVSKISLKKYKRNENKSKVLVCHDMMGGYQQDNYQCGYKDPIHNYRFLEWGICDYFIYFSHYRVSIPPPSYIDITHSKGVKCLGTFITEWEEGEKENELLLKGQFISKENNQIQFHQNKYVYADKLIEICKHYKFDGYLINIEAQVSNSYELAEWTRYLRDKIHVEVPGSVIIFYDSIISTGQLQWQSQLNNNNRMFFEVSDLFFTDYKWQVHQLQQSMEAAGNRKLDVFTGIDIFGRGTYGGGKFNTSDALHEIIRNGSSVAFFAPGWTYECGGGMESKGCFLRREQEFWHGVQCNTFFDPVNDKWDYTQPQQGNPPAWEHLKEENTSIAVSSFFPSFRQFRYNVPYDVNLNGKTIYFSFQVKGTPPKSNDQFVACIDVYENYRLVYSVDTKSLMLISNAMPFMQRFNEGLFQETKPDWQDIQLELTIPQMNASRITHFVFYQVGKDAEYWAGYYGARFKNEDMGFKSYEERKDLCKYLNTRRCCELPIHTFYNDGVGKYYFIEGVQQNITDGNIYHNNIHEFDFDYQFFSKKIKSSRINNNHNVNYTVSIDESQGWNGLSSLQLKGQLDQQSPILIKLLKTSISDCGKELFVDLNLKNASQFLDADIFFRNQAKNLVQMKRMLKKDRGNNWNTYFYGLDTQKEDIKEVKGIYLQLRSNQVEKIIINIGGISLYNDQIKNSYKDIMKKSEQIIESCKAVENVQNILEPTQDNLYLDLLLKFKMEENVYCKTKIIRIFINNQWIESTKKKEVLLEKLKISSAQQQFEVKAQIILDNGFHVPLEMIKPFIIKTKEQIIEL